MIMVTVPDADLRTLFRCAKRTALSEKMVITARLSWTYPDLRKPEPPPGGRKPGTPKTDDPPWTSRSRLRKSRIYSAIPWPAVRSYPMLTYLMDTDQIADLIARAQQQDPAAFDALVQAYSTRLYGYFYRLTGARHDAEDLLQELFVRLVRRIGEYQHEGRFDAWLFRIATNLVRDSLRRAKKAPVVGQEPSPGGLENAALDQQPDRMGPDPSEVVHRAEQVDQLQQAIGELPEAEREVILLRHFSQMTFREIAALMGTPLGTALARAHRGLIRLRELMANESGGRDE